MSKFEKCPKCGKKGLYSAVARNVGDCMDFGNRGSSEKCKYCNPRGVTKEEHEEFERNLDEQINSRKHRIKN